MDGTTKAVDFALKFEPTLSHILYEIKSKNLIGSRSDRVAEKIANEILSYSEKFQFGEAEIIKYVKGESIGSNSTDPIFSEFDKFLKDNRWNLSESQLKGLYSLIHQTMMYSLSPVQRFGYIEKTFPLFSGLKKLLLKERPSSGQLQWQYIAEHCPLGNKISKEQFIESFEKANGYYKNLSNDLTATAVAALVNHEIAKEKRFENTISQEKRRKGWFPDGMFRVPYQHTVSKEVIYIISFAFKLNLQQFDELFRSSVNSVFMPYDPKSAIVRFSLNYGKSYETEEKLYEDNEHIFDIPLSGDTSYDNSAMLGKMNNFFQSHTNSEDEQALSREFIDFLVANGVTNKHDILLNELREKKAQEYANRLYDKMDIAMIKNLYSNLYIDETDIPALLKERYGEKSETYCTILEDTIGQVSGIDDTSDEKNKAKILTFLCDGRKVYRHGLSSKAFTEARLNNLRTGNIVSDPKNKIHRDEILRIAYLDTLISYYSGELNDETVLSAFEEKANKMLSECLFQKLHITLLLDSALYIALSNPKKLSPGRFKAQYFQIFVPRKF